MSDYHHLPIQIYADGATRESLLQLYADPLIKGLTTNPTLMRKAGITDYEAFAKDILTVVKDKPISFEVFADTHAEMVRQARKIAAWQENVYVKIPVVDVRGVSSAPLIEELSREGARLNVTALLTLDQVDAVVAALQPGVPGIVSIFAGRIADTGRDPEPVFREAKARLRHRPELQLLWGSVREVFNIAQAARCGCDIVTVPHDILAKALKLGGMDLTELSIDTVRMFDGDARAAGFRL
jgi:transaldolase